MTYAHNNLKVTFGGTIYGGKEIWTNSLNIGHELRDFEYNALSTESDVNANIVSHIQAWFGSPTTHISPYAHLEWVKFAIIGTDGKYALLEDGTYRFLDVYDFAAVRGSQNVVTASSNVAPQLSVALTMESNVRRGPGRFGRIYPPLSGIANSAGVDDKSQDRVTSFKTLLDNINAAFDEQTGDDGYKVVIASAVGTGKNAPVTKVKVGQVIDTQRRRRNAFTEVYTELPVVSNAAV